MITASLLIPVTAGAQRPTRHRPRHPRRRSLRRFSRYRTPLPSAMAQSTAKTLVSTDQVVNQIIEREHALIVSRTARLG
jgi:hypothetical protein